MVSTRIDIKSYNDCVISVILSGGSAYYWNGHEIIQLLSYFSSFMKSYNYWVISVILSGGSAYYSNGHEIIRLLSYFVSSIGREC